MYFYFQFMLLSLNSETCLCFMFFNHVEEAREELREQVYDAMGEKEAKKAEGKSLTKPETDKEQESEVEKGGREDMDISEPEEKLQETVEPTSKQLTESSEEAKEAAIPGLNEDEVASGKTEQESLCTEKGKSISGAYVQNKEFRETVEEGEEIISLEKKPKETSEDQPIRAAEKQGTLMKVVEIEAEIDPQVKSADVGGEEPKDQVATSESELGKAVLMELSGQDVEASPVVAAEAGAEVSEKPGQEITVIPNNGPVVGQSTVGDQTPSEPQTSAERLTETKDGSSVEEVKAELVPEQEEAMLPVEESEAAGDGVETKVAQRATEKAPEDKFKIAANEETQERDEQMKEGEGNRDMIELQWVEYISRFDALIIGKSQPSIQDFQSAFRNYKVGRLISETWLAVINLLCHHASQ